MCISKPILMASLLNGHCCMERMFLAFFRCSHSWERGHVWNTCIFSPLRLPTVCAPSWALKRSPELLPIHSVLPISPASGMLHCSRQTHHLFQRPTVNSGEAPCFFVSGNYLETWGHPHRETVLNSPSMWTLQKISHMPCAPGTRIPHLLCPSLGESHYMLSK